MLHYHFHVFSYQQALHINRDILLSGLKSLNVSTHIKRATLYQEFTGSIPAVRAARLLLFGQVPV